MPAPIEIIRNAIVDLNIAASPAAVKARDLELGFNHYNRIVNRLALTEKMGWYMRNEAFPWAVSQQFYTIGPAAGTPDFVITGERPPFIDAANLVLTGPAVPNEIQLPVIFVQQYEALPQPTLSSLQPTKIYYSPTFPNGTLAPHPYPTNIGNKIRLFWKNQLTTVLFADIGTNIDLPQAYEDMLTSLLMVRLASIPAYGLQVTQEMKEMQMEAYNAVAHQNGSDPVMISTDLLGRHYGKHGGSTTGSATYFRTLGGIG